MKQTWSRSSFSWRRPRSSSRPRRSPGLQRPGHGHGQPRRLSKAKTRSISPENFTGEKGKAGMATEGPAKSAARDLGQGWKVSPCVRIQAGETFILADIEGPGAIQQIWMTPTGNWRYTILRIYWDGEDRALGRSARWAISSPAAGASTPRSPRCRSASTPAAPSTATGRCPSASAARITIENIGRRSR